MNRWALLLLLSAVAITCVLGFVPGAAAAETSTIAQASKDVNCPECGYENEPDLNYCIKCGTPLKEETPGGKTYCTQCGAPSAEGSTFCTACGYALEGEKPGLGASSAPPAHRIGIYFTGGLASYESDIGNSWAAGAGLTVPLFTRPGAAQLSLGLSTDVGFSTINDEFEGIFGSEVFKISLIPIRETALLGLAFGPRKMIKPFCGFGGGVGILTWEYVLDGLTLDEGTDVKPVFDIPFGCEFGLTQNFALGVKADYLIIPGDIEMEWEIERYVFDANAPAPDVFLFGGVARFDF